MNDRPTREEIEQVIFSVSLDEKAGCATGNELMLAEAARAYLASLDASPPVPQEANDVEAGENRVATSRLNAADGSNDSWGYSGDSPPGSGVVSEAWLRAAAERYKERTGDECYPDGIAAALAPLLEENARVRKDKDFWERRCSRGAEQLKAAEAQVTAEMEVAREWRQHCLTAEARVNELEEVISRLRSLVDPIALRLFDQHEAQQ